MSGHSLEEVKKHVKTYLMVFGTLLILTFVTVWVSYFHLPIHQAVMVALAVACTKATLVALFFMHLSNEKQIIYRALGLTAVMFACLMTITLYI